MKPRNPLHFDRRHDGGPFDIVGDVHGCAGELEILLDKLGYEISHRGAEGERHYDVAHPEDRRVVFLGDLVDRGPRSPDVLRLVMAMVEAGRGLCVTGNHDDKLRRWLLGRDVKVSHGLADTIEQIEAQPAGFRDTLHDFLDRLPHHQVLDGGRLIVAHAGLVEELHYEMGGRARGFALYGATTGEQDEYGLPVRLEWANEYGGEAHIVYGHMAVTEAVWNNRTICIDTGCVFGGQLTALRWPERELVEVEALETYYASLRPRQARAVR